jgi:superfamily I DNA and/or RNA helicase
VADSRGGARLALFVHCDPRGGRKEPAHEELLQPGGSERGAVVLQRLLTTLIRTDHEGEVEVGCITGYTAQVRLIIENLSRLPGSTPIETASKTEKVRIVVTSRCSIVIDVASVDAFQGQERDIIIFATTRANNGRQLGFLSGFNAVLPKCTIC